MVYYRELRCTYCKKLLAKGSGNVQKVLKFAPPYI